MSSLDFEWDKKPIGLTIFFYRAKIASAIYFDGAIFLRL